MGLRIVNRHEQALRAALLPCLLVAVVFGGLLIALLTPQPNRPAVLFFSHHADFHDAVRIIADRQGRLVLLDTKRRRAVAVFSKIPTWQSFRSGGIVFAIDAGGASGCGVRWR